MSGVRQNGRPKSRTKYYFEFLAPKSSTESIQQVAESLDVKEASVLDKPSLLQSQNDDTDLEIPSSPVRRKLSLTEEVTSEMREGVACERKEAAIAKDDCVSLHANARGGRKGEYIVTDQNGELNDSGISKSDLSSSRKAPVKTEKTSTNRIQKMLQSASRSKRVAGNLSPLKAVTFSSDPSEMDNATSSPIRVIANRVIRPNSKGKLSVALELLGSSSPIKNERLLLGYSDSPMPSRIPSDFPTENILDPDDIHIPFIPLDTFESAYKEVSLNKDEIEPLTKNEMIIHSYILLSDHFLMQSHQLDSFDTQQIVQEYYRLVQLAIVCLRILLEKYSHILTPTWELLLNYKLAKLYMQETNNLELAEECINKCTAIASRNKLLQLQFVGEFYLIEILESGNPKVLNNYINDKILFYSGLKLDCFANLFKFKKIQNTLLDNPKTGIAILQNISKDESLDQSTRCLFLLYLVSLKLFRGCSKSVLKNLDEVDVLLSLSNDIPPQLTAMRDLLKFYCLIQLNSKDLLPHASSMITSVNHPQTFRKWNHDGSFSMLLPVNFDGQLQQGEFMYKVQWISPTEFIVMTYYLCGVMLMSFRQATPFFNNALTLIDQIKLKVFNLLDFKQSNASLVNSSKQFIRCNYVMYNIYYYQVWERFLKNDFSHIDELNSFMVSYNEGKFAEEELCYYKLLLPKIFYLIGVYYLLKGDFGASKYYFLKARNGSSSVNGARRNNSIVDERPVTLLQMELGIGGSNIQPLGVISEVYIYSTIHLMVLNQFELNYSTKMGSFDSINKCYNFFTVLNKDLLLEAPERGAANVGSVLAIDNPLLQITYQVLLIVFQRETPDTSLLKPLFKCHRTNDVYLDTLILYLQLRFSSNINERRAYLSKCKEVLLLNDPPIGAKLIFIYILKELIHDCESRGDKNEIKAYENQLNVLEETFASRIQTMESYFKVVK